MRKQTRQTRQQQSAWQQVPQSVYGVIMGGIAGTVAVVMKPEYAVYLLAGLTIAATYAFFVSYQKATSQKWSPRQVFSPAPVMGALVVGVMAVSGAQYLGSSSASSAMGNIGSIVSAKGCDNLGSTASGNIGSIVRIDGGGTCDINDILKSPALKGNIGSIVIVDNACGDAAAAKANFNIGSIVKTTSVGPCKPNIPTTVVVQPETPPAVTPVSVPAELPQTGAGNIILVGLIAVVTGYLFSALYNLSKKTGKKA